MVTGLFPSATAFPRDFLALMGPLADKPVLGTRDVQGWAAGRVVAGRVRELMESTLLLEELEARMRALNGIQHIYRVSDIPNRHGHCNSNPNPDLVSRWDTS